MFVSLTAAIVALFALDLWLGSVRLAPDEVWRALFGNPSEGAVAYIVRSFRLPKAIVALLAGAALGASGLMMQTLFRNPLAGPYVLGVSSGASLGVALFLLAAPLLGAYVNDDVNAYLNTYAYNRYSRRLWWRLWILDRLPALWRPVVYNWYNRLAWVIATFL